MKMADVLGSKPQEAKFDSTAVHRDTVKRLLKLDDAQVAELTFALHCLSDDDAGMGEKSEKESGEKPSLLAILSKGRLPEKG